VFVMIAAGHVETTWSPWWEAIDVEAPPVVDQVAPFVEHHKFPLRRVFLMVVSFLYVQLSGAGWASSRDTS